MKGFVSLILIVATCSASVFGQEEESNENRGDATAISVGAATASAEHWLAIVDSAGWLQSYGEASELFKSSVSPDLWVQKIRGVRMPLGRLRSRELTASEYTTSLPGAPDGEYVVLKFATSFENKAEATETVTPMKDPDGEWRVSGYFIR